MPYDAGYDAPYVPVDFHPALLYPLQLLVIFAASFTRPHSSFRYAAVFLSGVFTWSFHKTCHNPKYFVNNVPKQFIGTFLTTYFFLAIERLLISEWYFDADGPTAYTNNTTNAKVVLEDVPKRVNASIWDRAVFAIDLLFSPRSIGKPWQIKVVPKYDDKDPGYVPSRGRFLIRTTVLSLCLFLVADFARMMPPPEEGIFSSRKIPLLTRLSEVTTEELITRIFATAAYYLNTYIITSLVANVCSLVSVGAGLSSPASWRPTYGSLSESYTVRKFWGSFWHQNIRATFESISNYITHDLLHLSKGSLVARYSKIYIAFIVSGLLHLGTDFGVGVRFRNSGALQYFCTCATGIMFEDAVEAIWRRLVGPYGSKQPTPRWQRYVGYVWTILFLCWCTPRWIYPLIARHRAGIDEVYPFGIAQYITRK